MRMPTNFLSFALVGFAAVVVTSARADDRPACERFDWPLARERAWFEAPDLPKADTGASLDGLPKGVVLKLRPATEVTFAAPSSRPARGDNPHSGMATVEIAEPGHYIFTISADGWLDVVQGGRVLTATAHTGSKDCAGLRKSVRFELQRGSATVQISSASADTMRIAMRRVD